MDLSEREAVQRAIAILREQLEPLRDVACPFCGRDGFDLIGLKSHLKRGGCEEYDGTPPL